MRRHDTLDPAVQVPVQDEAMRDRHQQRQQRRRVAQALEVRLHPRPGVDGRVMKSQHERAPGHLWVREHARERVELRTP